MSEPFTAVEEMIRCLAEDVNPAISLRHRVLAASHNARVRQLRQIRIQRASSCVVMCLCLMYVGIQVRWSFFQTLDSPGDREHIVAWGHAVEDSHGIMSDMTVAIASQVEVPTSHFSDPIEWEAAESHWKRRDRHSALISRYF